MNHFRLSLQAITPRLPQLVNTVTVASSASRAMSHKSNWRPGTYPATRRSDHVDTYASETRGKVTVHDPYEWLEHDTKETQDWVTSQEQYTRKFLDANPYRQRLEDEIRKSTNYERVGLPFAALFWHLMARKFGPPSLKKDGRWYWSHNTGLQAQSSERCSYGVN